MTNFLFTTLFDLCCSRYGLFGSTYSNVTPVCQSLMFVGMDGSFLPDTSNTV